MLHHRYEIDFANCSKHSIPVAVAMGEGYWPDIKHIVEAHCNTFKMAKEISNYNIRSYCYRKFLTHFKPSDKYSIFTPL